MPETKEIRDCWPVDHDWHLKLALLRSVVSFALRENISYTVRFLLLEYFHSKPLPKAPDDVLTLSQSLYAEEVEVSPYLYKVNLQGKTTSGAHDDRASKK